MELREGELFMVSEWIMDSMVVCWRSEFLHALSAPPPPPPPPMEWRVEWKPRSDSSKWWRFLQG